MRRTRRWLGAAAAVVMLVTVGATGGCARGGPSASGSDQASSGTEGGGGGSGDGTAAPLTIPISIARGQVQPNGEKVRARVGQQVVLQVTSDEADEIHAHTGGDGFELEVPAGRPTTGTLTPTQPGSFEIESHHLEKVIVILNVS